MERPTRVKVLGIFGIVLGGMGILNAFWLIIFPWYMRFELQMLDRMPNAGMSMMKAMWQLPHWFYGYSVVTGLITMTIEAFYLLAAVRFLQVKSKAIGMFYVATGLTILATLCRCGAYFSTGFIMGFSMLFGAVVWIVFKVVLLVLVMKSDLSCFRSSEPDQARL